MFLIMLIKITGSGLNFSYFLSSFLFYFLFIFLYSILRPRVRVRAMRSCCHITEDRSKSHMADGRV